MDPVLITLGEEYNRRDRALRLRFSRAPRGGWLDMQVRGFAEALEGLEGVEDLVCGRYSWAVHFAGHITTETALAAEIGSLLPDWAAAIGAAFDSPVLYTDRVRLMPAVLISGSGRAQ